MVEISMSGSGEGPVWVTGRGYSTVQSHHVDHPCESERFDGTAGDRLEM